MHNIPTDRSNTVLSFFSSKSEYVHCIAVHRKKENTRAHRHLVFVADIILKPEMQFSASGHVNYTKTLVALWLAVIKYVRACLCGLNYTLPLRQCESSEKKTANVTGDERNENEPNGNGVTVSGRK
jgi:hypothetical protein